MAVTAEPPAVLESARQKLDDLGNEVASIGRWESAPIDRWCLRLALTPSGLLAGGQIPDRTVWYLVVDDSYPAGKVAVYPAKDGGITATFAHQAPNEPGDASVPWRTGLLCLVESLDGHEMATARDEDRRPEFRLAWHSWRAIEWIRDASNDRLVKPGDRFELPWFGEHRGLVPVVAYLEDATTFEQWTRERTRIGLSEVVKVSGGESVGSVAIRMFGDLARRPLVVPSWGTYIADAPALPPALWMRFDDVPVRPPWQAPQSWRELTEWAADQGVDLAPTLRQGTSAIRDGRPHHVLIGFPIPERRGEESSRMAWAAFRLPALSNRRRQTAIRGFRTETANWAADRLGILAPDAPLSWVTTENWAPDQLSSRGRLGTDLSSASVAVIGAGALGSNIAGMLVRAGATEMAIIDQGLLEAGNLVRHTLDLRDVGLSKAYELAAALNRANPNAKVTAQAETLPTTDTNTLADLARADIVIDTTGAETVIEAMNALQWPKRPLFVIAWLSFGAERIHLYSVRGDRFSSEDFARQSAPWVEADRRPISEFPWRGIGCWSAVFPARADDVALLSAAAVRQIDGRFADVASGPDLVVFERHEDATISIARSTRRSATPADPNRVATAAASRWRTVRAELATLRGRLTRREVRT